MHKSVAIPGTVEFLNITSINPLISKCKIKVCYVGDEPNRNRSIITEQTARVIAQSLPGSPIVGYFNEEKNDFEEHNEYFIFKNGKLEMKTNTRPYGFIDTQAKVWFEEYLDDNTEYRKYLVTEGYLWTGEYPEAKAAVEGSGQPHSLHFSEDPEFLNAFWSKDENGNNQFFIVNEAVISNLCILGKDVEPCFEGSSVTQFSLDSEFKTTMFNLIEEMKDILKKDKGGISMPVEETKVPVTEEVIEDPIEYVKKKEDEEEKDASSKASEEKDEGKQEEKKDEKVEDKKEEEDDEEKKKKKTSYNLEEIPEYVALQSELNDLRASYSALETEANELKAFKDKIEKQEKEDLIKSFYMLSDEDKQDVVENIASYSYDEIKSKLSVICVDKRVSFEKETDDEPKESKTTEEVVTYNLNSQKESTSNSENKPAWLKRVDKQIENR